VRKVTGQELDTGQVATGQALRLRAADRIRHVHSLPTILDRPDPGAVSCPHGDPQP